LAATFPILWPSEAAVGTLIEVALLAAFGTAVDVGTAVRTAKRGNPTAIRSLAVTVADVITALEANCSVDRGAVLRITPPFAGRMRARIHVAGGEGDYEGETEPIHLDPAALVDDIPAYPTADETAAADAEAHESHRRRHTERVEQWRETVGDRLRERTTIDHPAGSLDVRLAWLGSE